MTDEVMEQASQDAQAPEVAAQPANEEHQGDAKPETTELPKAKPETPAYSYHPSPMTPQSYQNLAMTIKYLFGLR